MQGLKPLSRFRSALLKVSIMRLPNRILLSLLCISLSLAVGCQKRYQDISKQTLVSEILPYEQIEQVTVVRNESVNLETVEKQSYRIIISDIEDLKDIINQIQAKQANTPVKYTTADETYGYFKLILSLLTVMIIIGFITHLILMGISLKKILSIEKKVGTKIFDYLIVIFLPVVGPVVYLTSKN